MFDIENQDAIMELIDTRNENCIVIPLYVNINNELYGLWELDEITSFSRNMIKVGFGSSKGLFIKSPFPNDCMYEFEMKKMFSYFDYDENTETFYFVFESGLLNEDELTDDIHKQMQQYIEAIADRVQKYVDEYRTELRKRLMEDEDSYISNSYSSE